MKYLTTLMMICLLVPVMFTGQPKQGNDGTFDIYIFPAFYSKNVSDNLLQGNCAVAHLLTQSMIDPDKDQQPDLDAVKKHTAELYPDANATGLFVVDWEGQAFNDLRKYDRDDSRFKSAEDTYIRLVSAIKEYRPGLKVGVYGLPFRSFSDAQRVQNADTKLDGLLSKCDVLTPSLYIMYTNEEVGEQRNMDYLKQNMDQFLGYGARLKKPVIPFFWYKVHPSNKKYGMNVMPKGTVQKYLSLLSTYGNQAGRLNGIIWWEGGEKIDKTPAGNRGVSAAAGADISSGETARDSIIINYTAPFIRKKKQ